jgi:hypothetical protein
MLWSSFEYGSVVNDEVKRALTYDNQAKIRLAITPIMIFIALLVNRRAILVSILIYIYVSIAKLTDIDTIHFSDSVGEYISILVVGSLILILSVGWHPIRQILLKIVPYCQGATLEATASDKSSKSSPIPQKSEYLHDLL